MANDEAFDGLALAVGVQSAFGTINGTIRDLSGTIDETDGCVLGDKESGDADSGIVSPSLEAVVREVAAVASSFTERADSFQRLAVSDFSITFAVQGNGATATPTPGEADLSVLFPGYEALYEMMGLIGAAGGSDAEQDYTPRHEGSSGGSTIYGTIKVWVGDLSIVFEDCLVETAEFVCTPGGNVLCTCNIKVGAADTANISDGVTFPTITYGFMEDEAAPVVEEVAFASFGQTRGFENLTITVSNTIEEFGDSNVATTGIRQAQTRRVFSVDGTLYVNTSDSEAAIQNLISTTAPTDDLSFQVGTVAGAAATINAFKFEVNNLQNKAIKYNRIGQALAVEISGAKAAATSAGAEFVLIFN
jgi:hypothetical protein